MTEIQTIINIWKERHKHVDIYVVDGAAESLSSGVFIIYMRSGNSYYRRLFYIEDLTKVKCLYEYLTNVLNLMFEELTEISNKNKAPDKGLHISIGE